MMNFILLKCFKYTIISSKGGIRFLWCHQNGRGGGERKTKEKSKEGERRIEGE